MDLKNKCTPWWVAGDINGFFGLFSNSLTNFLTAIALLAFAISMPHDIVFGSIVPAAALTIGLGNIILGVMARRLSVREGRTDITAMPYGLSVPHYFAVAFGVILPVYMATHDWRLAWATGAVWGFIQGVIMLAGAFVGPTIKKYIPSSAMLGALAGLALTLIAGNPIGEVFGKPYIGLTCLAILMVGWLSGKKMPLNLPAGAVAILVGTVIAWVVGDMRPAAVSEAVSGINVPAPTFVLGMFADGFKLIAPFLPAAIPLAIYDFLESLDNLESAEKAGEHYPVMAAMSVPAVLTILGSFLGNPFPTIIYIGHPGWKSTGARVGYSWATGLGILILSFTGLLRLVSAVIPLVALLPILVYIAMVIGTQAFATAKKRHMPAIILAFMPFIGTITTLKISGAVGAVNNGLAAAGANVSVALAETAEQGQIAVTHAMLSGSGVPWTGWLRLAQGDIISGMLLATIAIFTIDRKYKVASMYCLLNAALSFFGIIHAPSFGFNAAPQVALGYAGMAVVLYLTSVYKPEENTPPEEEGETA